MQLIHSLASLTNSPFVNSHRPLPDIVHFYRVLALVHIVNSAIS